ncbi:MAG: endonuclease/exonuclease/phosphatase family protein [Proteobacteria bacterium]|nr:endonuclease/exonuclease/phosphatase family protein [Pseudomonadota bacterium]
MRTHVSHTTQHPAHLLRVATYNIHKGVRGLGPRKRLEIHNLALGIEALDADLVFLQEVRRINRREALNFPDTHIGWPRMPQADYLAPEGYAAAYRTNATTRHGEHGNALLSRWPVGDIGHHDVSDHPFEQRGLLHVSVDWNGVTVHAIVAHFGLIHSSRVRQVERLARFIEAEVPHDRHVVVAGDFNDWGQRLDAPMAALGLHRAMGEGETPAHCYTFPSRLPVFSMDRIYVRGLTCHSTAVPRGVAWARMSDHLPLIADLALA